MNFMPEKCYGLVRLIFLISHNALTLQFALVFVRCLCNRGFYFTLYILFIKKLCLNFVVNCSDILEGRIFIRKLPFFPMNGTLGKLSLGPNIWEALHSILETLVPLSWQIQITASSSTLWEFRKCLSFLVKI